MASLAERIAKEASSLPPGQRRVAQYILENPDSVLFGTTADIASRTKTSAPTVVRLAVSLGFGGFVDLRRVMRAEMAHRSRSPVDLARKDLSDDPLELSAAVQGENLRSTIASVDRRAFKQAVARLSNLKTRVYVASSEPFIGVTERFVTELSMIRDEVFFIQGSEVRVARSLALLDKRDTFIVVDLWRHARWLFEATKRVHNAGAHVVAITDTALSPYASLAHELFLPASSGVSPFYSQVGVLVLLEALFAAVLAELQPQAVPRMELQEKSLQESGGFLEEAPRKAAKPRRTG